MIVEYIILSIVTVICAVTLYFVGCIRTNLKQLLWSFNIIEQRTNVTQKLIENNTMLIKDLNVTSKQDLSNPDLDDSVESKVDDLYKNPDGVYSRKAYLANTNSKKS